MAQAFFDAMMIATKGTGAFEIAQKTSAFCPSPIASIKEIHAYDGYPDFSNFRLSSGDVAGGL
ncbi:MAG: hypothetical protein K8F27_15210 [Sulfuricellaceae bacterium]|nr:hypothetical protein [Sulfuricellaceae bacterium]